MLWISVRMVMGVAMASAITTPRMSLAMLLTPASLYSYSGPRGAWSMPKMEYSGYLTFSLQCSFSLMWRAIP
jgi:hypothetical protein